METCGVFAPTAKEWAAGGSFSTVSSKYVRLVDGKGQGVTASRWGQLKMVASCCAVLHLLTAAQCERFRI